MRSNGKFKRGDNVLRIDGEDFKHGMKMKYIYSIVDEETVQVAELNGNWRNEDLRHATQEEAYWMEELHSKDLRRGFVGDFRVGDVLVDKEGDTFTIYNEDSIKVGQRDYISNLEGIYPTESFKRYPQEEEK